MDEAKLKEIEDRATRATAGPWIYFGEPEDNVFWGQIRSAAEDGHFDHITDTPELDERDNDMQFIAHAREDVPLLCKTVRGLWKELQDVERGRNLLRSQVKDQRGDIRVLREELRTK